MRFNLIEIFPCGYTKKLSFECWRPVNTEDDDKGCPLHGKNCPPQRHRK